MHVCYYIYVYLEVVVGSSGGEGDVVDLAVDTLIRVEPTVLLPKDPPLGWLLTTRSLPGETSKVMTGSRNSEVGKQHKGVYAQTAGYIQDIVQDRK